MAYQSPFEKRSKSRKNQPKYGSYEVKSFKPNEPSSTAKSGENPLWTLLNSLSSVGGAVKQQAYNWTDNKLDWKDIPLAESLVQGAKGQVNAWKDGALDLNDLPGVGVLSAISRESVTGKQLLQERFGAQDWKDTKLGEADRWWQAINPIDVAGFGVDVLTDPLSYLSGGGSAAARMGRVAQKQAVLDKAAELGVQVTKSRNVGKMVDELATKAQAVKAKELVSKGVNFDLIDRALPEYASNLRNEIGNIGKKARFETQNKMFAWRAPFTEKAITFGNKPEWMKVKDAIVDAPTAQIVRNTLAQGGIKTEAQVSNFMKKYYPGFNKPEDMTSQAFKHFSEGYNPNTSRNVPQVMATFREVPIKEPKIKTGSKKEQTVKAPKVQEPVVQAPKAEKVVAEPKAPKVEYETLSNKQRRELSNASAHHKNFTSNVQKLTRMVQSGKATAEEVQALHKTVMKQLDYQNQVRTTYASVKQVKQLDTELGNKFNKLVEGYAPKPVEAKAPKVTTAPKVTGPTEATLTAAGKAVQGITQLSSEQRTALSQIQKDFGIGVQREAVKRGRKKMVSPSEIGKKEETVVTAPKPEVTVVKPVKTETKPVKAKSTEPAKKRGPKPSGKVKVKPPTGKEKLISLLEENGLDELRNNLRIPERNVPKTIEEAKKLYEKQQGDIRADILSKYNKFRRESAKVNKAEVVTEREQNIRNFLKDNPELDEKLVRDTFGKKGEISLARFTQKTAPKISKREQEIQDFLKQNKDVNEEVARKAFGRTKPVSSEQYKKYIDAEAKKASRVEAYQLEQSQLEYMRKLPLKLNELQIRKITEDAVPATQVADHLVYNVPVGFEGLFNKIGKPKEFSKFLSLTTQPSVGSVSVRFKMLDNISLKATNTKAVANGVVDFSAEIPEDVAVDFIKNIDSITIPQKLLKTKGYKQLREAFPDAEEIVNANGSITIKPKFKVAQVTEKARYRPETVALMKVEHPNYRNDPDKLLRAFEKADGAGKLIDNYEYQVRFGFKNRADLEEFLKPHMIKKMLEAKVPFETVAKEFGFITKNGSADKAGLYAYLQDVEDVRLGLNKKKSLSYKSDKGYSGDSDSFLGGTRDDKGPNNTIGSDDLWGFDKVDKRLAFNARQSPALPSPLDRDFKPSINNEKAYAQTQTNLDRVAKTKFTDFKPNDFDNYILDATNQLASVGVTRINPKYLGKDAEVIAGSLRTFAEQIHASRTFLGDINFKGLKLNISPINNPDMLANYAKATQTILMTPQGRFSVAHEIAHFLLDRMQDKTAMKELVDKLKGTEQFGEALKKIGKNNRAYWTADDEVFARAFEEAVLNQTGVQTSLRAGEALGLNADDVADVAKAIGVDKKWADSVYDEGKKFAESQRATVEVKNLDKVYTKTDRLRVFQQDMGGRTDIFRPITASKLFNARSLGSKNNFVDTFGRDVSLTNVEYQGGKVQLVNDLKRVEKISKSMMQNELEAVPFVVENAFPKGMSKAEYFKANGIDESGIKRIEAFTEEFSSIMKQLGIDEQEVGLLKELRRNYFPHIYELSDAEAEAIFKSLPNTPELAGLRGRSAKNGFSNERKGFQTMAEVSDYMEELQKKIGQEVSDAKRAKLQGTYDKLEKAMKMKPIDVLAKRYAVSIRSTVNKRLYNKLEKAGLVSRVAEGNVTTVYKRSADGKKVKITKVKEYPKTDRDDMIPVETKEQARLLGLNIGDMVQKDVYNGMKKLDTVFTDEGLNKILGEVDAIHSIWKRMITTLIPRHYVTNMIGHIFNNSLAGVELDSYNYSGKLLRAAKNGKLNAEQKQFMKQAQRYGVVNQGFLTDFQRFMKYDIKDERFGDKVAAKIGGVANKATFGLGSKYVQALEKVGQGSDDYARLAHFYDVYKKTGSYDLAADSVKKYLFNYKELSSADRIIRAGLIPFWTWMRNNIPLQMEKLFSEPRFALTWFKIKEAMQGEVTESDAPAWANESGFIAGNYVYNPQLPLADIGRIVDTPKNVLKEIASSLNPTVRMPLEIASGKEFFSGKDISPTWSETPNQDYLRYIAKNAGPIGAIPTKKDADIVSEIRKLFIPGVTQHTYPKE